MSMKAWFGSTVTAIPLNKASRVDERVDPVEGPLAGVASSRWMRRTRVAPQSCQSVRIAAVRPSATT